MDQNKSTKKGKIIGIIVGIIAFAISFYVVQQFFKSDLELELKKVVTEMNKQGPKQIDQFTRLDSVSSLGKTNLIYYYTLIDMAKSEVNLDTVNKYVRPEIIENIKNSPELKIYRDNNITLDYKYYDRNGDFVLDIAVTPELYKSE
ncbi:hypothetical protein [Gelidibacter maritimus]|uniref:Uncharacterized protein n=1 Tax=Gelidibacter maritimus TaxID=2761487 RepID=A0A7W2R4W6_9FLAO|nr:hypothetical protein [Gelidibacter maritimus]MBA6154289.1 hypothetical protein [Gelidibacter maritimus]